MRPMTLVSLALFCTLTGCGRPAMLPLAPGPRLVAPLGARAAVTPRREKAIRLYVKSLFDRADTSHDGKVTPKEWEDRQVGSGNFADWDANRDRLIDFDEYLA